MLRKYKIIGLTLVFALAIALAACGSDDDNNNNNEANNDNSDNAAENDESADGIELGDTEITVSYVAWAGEIARTPILVKVLEKAGYDVDAKQVEAGPMWSSVADGSSDFTTAAWLPATHQSYWEKYSDDVDVIGTFVDEAPLALAVPEYMDDDLQSVEDLKDNEELGESVDWKITGIDPGAGIMQNSEKALDEYELDNWDIQEASESAMLAELQKKMDDEEDIVVPLWKPHWAFAEMDLRMLDDPKNVYGDADEIQAVGSTEFEDKAPAAYEIVKRFAEDYNGEIENDLLVKVNVEDGDPDEVAEQYLEDNQDLVDDWLDGIATE